MGLKKPTVLVYVEHPMCSIDCADGVRDVLLASKKYTPLLVGPDSFPYLELTPALLSKAACLLVPGGLGDSDQYDDSHLRKLRHTIKDYVTNGGRYFGICMGAYLAGHHYLNILQKNTKAAQYVRRKRSTVTHENPDVVSVNWQGEDKTMYFFDGAVFVPKKKYRRISGEVVARYRNGDAAAIIQRCGAGRVGVVGTHPEAHKWWFYVEKKLRSYWHSCIHHDLVLTFLSKLLN